MLRGTGGREYRHHAAMARLISLSEARRRLPFLRYENAIFACTSRNSVREWCCDAARLEESSQARTMMRRHDPPATEPDCSDAHGNPGTALSEPLLLNRR